MTRLSLSVLLMAFAVNGFSQEPGLSITDRKERLLILPSAATGELQPVADEAVNIVSDVATSLGRFDVVDRSDLEEILREQALQLTGIVSDSMVVEVGQIAAAHEAVIVDILNFHQEGVPPEEDKEDDEDDEEGFFGKLALAVVKGIVERGLAPSEQKEQDPFPHNIQTTLSVRVKQVDVETGTSLKSFTVTTDHTGGTRGYSRSKVMEEFRQRAVREIKEFYVLTSEVVSITGSEVLLFLGSAVGVRPGTLFEIVEPDQVKTFGERDIVVPGRRSGVVEVHESSSEANRSVVLRSWLPVEPGHKALEYTRTPIALDLRFFYSSDSRFSGLQGSVIIRPLHFTSFGGEFRLGTVTDTYGDSDFMAGLGGHGSRKFLKLSRLSMTGGLKLHFDFAFRSDDNSQTVVATIFSATTQLGMEILLSEGRDLTVALGYRLSSKSSHWTYSEQTSEGTPKQVDAAWRGQPPEVDLSGPFLSVGIRLYFF